MSDELESLASAYLDDEVPLEARASIEQVMAADASRAEELRSLTVVRDMVAGLSRPAAPDVSGAVLARIVAPRGRIFNSPLSTSAWIATATAAGLLAIAFGLTASSRSRGGRPNPPPALVVSPIASPPAAAVIASDPAPDPEPVGPPAALAASPAPAAEDRAVAGLEFLSRPGMRRVFLISAQDDAADSNEAATLLEISSHRDFFRLDPPVSEAERGGPAAVFAAELDPNELTTLRHRLSGAFAGRLDEVEADHLLLTKLARVSRVTALKGDPAGEVLFPQNQMALQSAAVVGASPVLPREGGRLEGPPAPPASDAVEGTSPAGDQPSIVLIWLVGRAAR